MNHRTTSHYRITILRIIPALLMGLLIAGTAAADDSAAAWPIYRGNPALSGLASGSLPDRMRLL